MSTNRMLSFEIEKREVRQIENIVERKRINRLMSHWKLIFILFIPILGYIFLSAKSLQQTFYLHSETKLCIKSVSSSNNIVRFVQNLQREIGISALTLQSDSPPKELYLFRNHTDKSLAKHKLCLSNEKVTSEITLETICRKILNWRKFVDNRQVSVKANIIFYTNNTRLLMRYAIKNLAVTDDKRLLKAKSAGSFLLELTHYLGLKRALCPTFYTKCPYSKKELNWFQSLDGTMEYLFHIVSTYPKWIVNELYKHDVDETMVLSRIKIEVDNLMNLKKCSPLSVNESLFWFSNTTRYIDIIHAMRYNLDDFIYDLLIKINNKIERDITVNLFIQVIGTIVCVFISACYMVSADKKVIQLCSYIKTIKAHLTLMTAEKNQTENLLYKMFPRKVADILKQDGSISPEYFDEVTIYFSGTVGFTDIASETSPFQIVDWLNNLYSQMDECIGNFDVYKVETIGDAYMAVSGLPDRNEEKHGKEIANMALRIRQLTHGSCVPHLTNNVTRLRIGLHSGSCVAGVIGTKMPRYCLFGDTVNTASRIETYGQGNSSRSRKNLCHHLKSITNVSSGKNSYQSKHKKSSDKLRRICNCGTWFSRHKVLKIFRILSTIDKILGYVSLDKELGQFDTKLCKNKTFVWRRHNSLRIDFLKEDNSILLFTIARKRDL
ncbi:hypothetical protein KUTeg_005488 [Tegillarca granosa]|uniref:Guanylate cyclase domain-containing protein n=1 Tax=Tegillarca granosa TaxID=220873 RepID=A0ABQ9FJZ3_TEGGR|nr:hypothetical protein KUTeg_005488 [Tegillarca granosa]